ncbi:MAG: hypothetical protein DMG06_02905 [Acidobacteria bacterium]|nr:MAG: hypothetical protein DMG06_02905 [Acidobacteriota bacterium]
MGCFSVESLAQFTSGVSYKYVGPLLSRRKTTPVPSCAKVPVQLFEQSHMAGSGNPEARLNQQVQLNNIISAQTAQAKSIGP